MVRNGKEYVSLRELIGRKRVTQHAARLRLHRAGIRRTTGQWRWPKGSSALKRARQAIFG